MVGNKCKSSSNYANIAIHVNEIKISNETALHFLLCLGHMVQMFSRYSSDNFLFEEGW